MPMMMTMMRSTRSNRLIDLTNPTDRPIQQTDGSNRWTDTIDPTDPIDLTG